MELQLQHLARVETRTIWPTGYHVYSFTGTRRFLESNTNQRHEVGKVLREFCHDGSKFVTGACPGIDAYVQRRAIELYPEAEHEVIVPGVRIRGIEWVIPTDPRVRVIQLPEGVDTRDRNRLLVARAHHVCGFADYPEQHPRSKRSGTWMTIRMARAAHKLCRIVVFNES